MTTYKLPDVRTRGSSVTPCRYLSLVGLFVAIALQFSTRTAIAADRFVQPVTLNIPAGTHLEEALIEWGRKAGLTVMIDARSVTGQLAVEMHGTFNTGEALKMLLRNSGLIYTQHGKLIHIVQTTRAERLEKASNELADLPSTSSDIDGPADRGEDNENNSVSSANGGGQIDEVLVTAQKTGVAERLQDVPIPISVISAQELMDMNQSKIGDYFDQIPGLAIATSGPIWTVSIRGIGTGINNNPTVGYTLDDVPLGSSINIVSVMVPNINPADLAQVEVLRGPQGTLYGDTSMGGLIRYVTVDPSTDRVFGDVRVGGDDVFNGRNLGYNTSAAVNLPLTDTLAIRASAFTRLDPGFVDDVETGARGVNTTKVGGARIVAKWSPSTDFSLKFSALYEKSDQYGSSTVDVPTSGYPQTSGLGDLQQIHFWGETGIFDQEYKNVSLTINANVAGMKLTAVSGYTFTEQRAGQDDTQYNFVPAPFGAATLDIGTLHRFTQEVRLTDTLGSHLEWQLGGFFDLEDSMARQEIDELAPITGAIVGAPGSIYWGNGPNKFTEDAGFAALTWKVVDRFDVQFGARESYLSLPAINKGYFNGGSLIGELPGPATYSPYGSPVYDANSFTYLVSPRFKLSPDTMIYARAASGFRPGSGISNPSPTQSCVVLSEPCQQNPDKLSNYEVGVKADFLDHTLSVDSSIYYIDWKDLQLNLTRGALAFSGNGGGAKSQGLDLSLDWKPLQGLTISTWVSWNQAQITQSWGNTTYGGGTAGQPLPYTSRFSSNFSVEKDFLITGNIRAFLAGKEIYMGERLGEFTDPYAPRQELPAYSQTDLRAGIKSDPWTFNLYVNNVADRRGLLFGGIGSPNGYEFSIINPRTIGLSVERTF